MGAQTVIAIALETPKPKPEQFKSLSSVLRQTVRLPLRKMSSAPWQRLILSFRSILQSSPPPITSDGEISLKPATGLHRHTPPIWRGSSCHLKSGTSISLSAATVCALPSGAAESFQSPAQAHLSKGMHRLSLTANSQAKLCRSMSLRGSSREWSQPQQFPAQPTHGSRSARQKAATRSSSLSGRMTRCSCAYLLCMLSLPASHPDSE